MAQVPIQIPAAQVKGNRADAEAQSAAAARAAIRASPMPEHPATAGPAAAEAWSFVMAHAADRIPPHADMANPAARAAEQNNAMAGAACKLPRHMAKAAAMAEE